MQPHFFYVLGLSPDNPPTIYLWHPSFYATSLFLCLRSLSWQSSYNLICDILRFMQPRCFYVSCLSPDNPPIILSVTSFVLCNLVVSMYQVSLLTILLYSYLWHPSFYATSLFLCLRSLPWQSSYNLICDILLFIQPHCFYVSGLSPDNPSIILSVTSFVLCNLIVSMNQVSLLTILL